MKYLTKRQRKRKKIQIFNRFGQVYLKSDAESGIGVDVDNENEVELNVGDVDGDADVDGDGDGDGNFVGDLDEKFSNSKVSYMDVNATSAIICRATIQILC